MDVISQLIVSIPRNQCETPVYTQVAFFIISALIGLAWIVLPIRVVMPTLFFSAYGTYVYFSRTAVHLSQDLTKFASWIRDDFEGYMVYREYLYFETGRFFYHILNDTRLAIFSQDALWFVSVILIDRQIAKIKGRWSGYAPVVLCSFAAVLGVQNFFRQFLAITIIALGYANVRYGNKKLKGSVLAVAGIFFHNAAMLVGPTFVGPWIKKLPLVLKILVMVTAVLMVVVGLAAMAAGDLSDLKKSNAATGLNLSWAYVGLLLAVFLVPLYESKYNVMKAIVLSPALVIGVILTSAISLLFNSTPAERVGLMFFVIGLVDVIYIVDKWPNQKRRLCLAAMMLAFLVPTFLFPNARQFLFLDSYAPVNDKQAQYTK